MKLKICMHLPVTTVLPEKNAETIEKSEDNLVCRMHIIVMVAV